MNVDSTHIEKWQNKPSNKPDYRGASIIGTNISNLHANLLYKIKSKFGDQSVHIPARKAPSFLLPSSPPPLLFPVSKSHVAPLVSKCSQVLIYIISIKHNNQDKK